MLRSGSCLLLSFFLSFLSRFVHPLVFLYLRRCVSVLQHAQIGFLSPSFLLALFVGLFSFISIIVSLSCSMLRSSSCHFLFFFSWFVCWFVFLYLDHCVSVLQRAQIEFLSVSFFLSFLSLFVGLFSFISIIVSLSCRMHRSGS